MSNWTDAMTHYEDVTAVLITREKAWPVDARCDFPFRDSFVETACPNVLRRFELAAQAQTAHVYVQDDDCEIDIARLYRHYQQYGSKPLTNAITRGHQKIYENTGVTLIGWGCFFPRELAQQFVASLDKYRRLFPDELDLEADRIFTFVNRPHQNVVMPIREFRRTYCMSNRPGHYTTRDRMIRRLRDMAGECI